MTTHGATELDMDTKTLVVQGYDVKYVMVGKNGTWIKFHDGDKVQVNTDAEVKVLRQHQNPLTVRSSNGSIAEEIHSVNMPFFAVIVISFALLITRWLK